MRIFKMIGAVLIASVVCSTAHATPVTLGGITTDSSNFADSAELRFGDGRIFQDGGPAALSGSNFSDALSGSNVRDGFLCESESSYCEFDVSFDGGVTNEAGDDIAIFGLGAGTNELFDIIVNGVRVSNFQLVDTGSLIAGTNFALVALQIDLSVFGLAIGDTINSIRIALLASTTDKEEFAAFASLNDPVATPLPAAFLLFIGGALGLAKVSRKKKA